MCVCADCHVFYNNDECNSASSLMKSIDVSFVTLLGDVGMVPSDSTLLVPTTVWTLEAGEEKSNTVQTTKNMACPLERII